MLPPAPPEWRPPFIPPYDIPDIVIPPIVTPPPCDPNKDPECPPPPPPPPPHDVPEPATWLVLFGGLLGAWLAFGRKASARPE